MASAVGSLSLANNQFSLDLYRTLIVPQSHNKNAILSPFSIFSALAMLDVGAGGTTRDEILMALKLKGISGGANDLLNAGFKELFSKVQIRTRSENSRPIERFERQSAILNLANRVYIQKGFETKSAFTNMLQSFYGSDLGKVDFARQPERAKNEINQWVENVTNGKIKDLFKDMDSSTVMALVSAIYFKAEWEDHFRVAQTVDGDFFTAGGNSIKTKLMRMRTDDSLFAEFRNLDATALLKPYAHSSVHMIIILPNKIDGLSALEKSLSVDLFDVSRYGKFDVDVTLPKFRIEDSYGLNDGLKTLGINAVFSENANLSGIADVKIKLSDAVHKVFIEVDEKGTEAAAATGMRIQLASAMISFADRKRVFKADHPFLFAIQHRQTGAILFLGRVENPNLK